MATPDLSGAPGYQAMLDAKAAYDADQTTDNGTAWGQAMLLCYQQLNFDPSYLEMMRAS